MDLNFLCFHLSAPSITQRPRTKVVVPFHGRSKKESRLESDEISNSLRQQHSLLLTFVNSWWITESLKKRSLREFAEFVAEKSTTRRFYSGEPDYFNFVRIFRIPKTETSVSVSHTILLWFNLNYSAVLPRKRNFQFFLFYVSQAIKTNQFYRLRCSNFGLWIWRLWQCWVYRTPWLWTWTEVIFHNFGLRLQNTSLCTLTWSGGCIVFGIVFDFYDLNTRT